MFQHIILSDCCCALLPGDRCPSTPEPSPKHMGGLPSHTERGLQLTERSYPGASVERPGYRLEVNCEYSQIIIGSEVSITTYNLLMASDLAQPDAQSPTAAAQQCDFWCCTILRMGLA